MGGAFGASLHLQYGTNTESMVAPMRREVPEEEGAGRWELASKVYTRRAALRGSLKLLFSLGVICFLICTM